MNRLKELGINAKKAAPVLAAASEQQKNNALMRIADALMQNSEEIIEQNMIDLDNARKNGLPNHMLDRLALNFKRIEDIAAGVRHVATLKDPVGEVLSMTRRPNGLLIGKQRVPLGVIAIIYESRPNVTVDATALCIKSGNTVILRGGKEAFLSNIVLTRIMRECLVAAGLPEDCVAIVEDTSRESAIALMQLSDYVDVLIPRGGAGLIKSVVENAKVPVIETGVGNCHTYVDNDADLDMATEILYNAKCQRPSVCNAAETLLVAEKVASEFLPRAKERLDGMNVEWRGCEKTKEILHDIKDATEEDYYTEFLDYIIAVKVVSGVEEAVAHINKYGSGHSEAIVTNNYFSSQRFLKEVDAACVYVNASTRFTDGFVFGLGAEIGISTQKMHARGPMGLDELTSVKYIIYGEGQIR
ncbi:MAG: glutamate-5-semialdehyde dehydrogenase [Clostridiales bacterium]|mgnify:CR=1 FL=1|jgi:glutamate-5-semialdehyde dehydrogenase|nr:glutamate-5-semialdehyde dehydrogenase [Clostridiales bacterium]